MENFATLWNRSQGVDGHVERLLAAIQLASSRDWYVIEPDWKAYQAARLAMRAAREAGLYPTTADLERETRRAA